VGLVVVKLELIAIGDSLGVALPEEVLARLKVRVGDFLVLTEAPDGFLITRSDPDLRNG